ncbi:hypothetical protein Ctaglu_47600 [Clostridium tagluense]|uniref:Uncharacterized protein n=1 Tax=Clostridium tagluense TaxID=360422 RepID=A0A401UUB8_9CLOT|nr:hypothetical protein Ctaglu_47600 [Clostridium tagluense]
MNFNSYVDLFSYIVTTKPISIRKAYENAKALVDDMHVVQSVGKVKNGFKADELENDKLAVLRMRNQCNHHILIVRKCSIKIKRLY